MPRPALWTRMVTSLFNCSTAVRWSASTWRRRGCLPRIMRVGQLISKTIEIVGGLRGFLDMEKGGEIAEQLENLYEYMERRLLQANLKNDVEILDEVAGLIREVKEGWDGIREEVVSQGLV